VHLALCLSIEVMHNVEGNFMYYFTKLDCVYSNDNPHCGNTDCRLGKIQVVEFYFRNDRFLSQCTYKSELLTCPAIDIHSNLRDSMSC